MPATRTRTKYQFKTRADAETAYKETDRQRLASEWFATAIMQGRLVEMGKFNEGYRIVTVGYFITTHSAFVYATHNEDRIHCIRGIWDVDHLADLIAALMRYEDSHEFGRLLDAARTAAWKAMING